MENKISFCIEWKLSDVMAKYPELTLAQAQQIIDDLYKGREALMQEGWYVIDDIVSSLTLI